MGTSKQDDAQLIAELVDRLFKTHRKPNGQEYSTREVSQGIGGRIAPSYIAKLRRGEAPNPSREVLRQLCIFFKVPASYFFPELEQLGVPQTSELNALEQAHQVFRQAGLAPEEIEYLDSTFKHFLRRPRKNQE